MNNCIPENEGIDLATGYVGPIEAWRKCFREGVAPLLSNEALEAIRKALVSNDPRLVQGCTAQPPWLHAVEDWPVESACLIGYAGWVGEGLETVGEVEEFFARTCFEIDGRLGDPAACRHFLNWHDDTPRPEMFASLLPEVERAISQRQPRRPEETLKQTYARVVKTLRAKGALPKAVANG